MKSLDGDEGVIIQIRADRVTSAPLAKSVVRWLVFFQIRLNPVMCVAFAKAVVATVIVLLLLSGHLTVADVERFLSLLFGQA